MFSGDKLLGGPQAGIIVGTKTAIAKIKRHPLKRTVRVSKIVMAALEATLRIYDSDHELQQRLPVLSMLTRPPDQIQSTAERIAPTLLALAGPEFQASVVPCHSQIGSGALPEERLPSFAVELTPMNVAKPAQLLKKTLTRLRTRRPAIIGRVRDDKLLFDCRCLLPADETLLVGSLR
jgi:L-seryl-tRNA(Ser) seleniumtransferase